MVARVLTTAVVLASLAAGPAEARSAGALRPFSSCGALLRYARSHGSQSVRTGWVPAPMTAAQPTPTRVPLEQGSSNVAPQAAAPDTAAGGPVAAPTFSTTNVQEQGVDEPDVVKTDGTTLYAVANSTLHVIDVSDPAAPRLVGTLALDEGYGQELLLHGHRLLVLQTAWLADPSVSSTRQVASSPIVPSSGGRPVTRLTEVDVSHPATPTVVARERDDGEYVTARMVGDSVRVVLASRPPVLFAVAAATAGTRARAVGKRLRAVQRAKLAAWRPHSYFRRGRRQHFRSLVGCGDVSRPVHFSGLDTVTVLTVDMAKGLPSTDARSIMSDADVVYGSSGRLYVATQRWFPPRVLQREQPPTTTTQIHEFDTTDPDTTRYVGTGSVSGFLLNQFALSEQDGVLRAATTDTPQWWPGGSSDAGAGSSVTTLDEDTLAPLGKVSGLGRGQRIYAVRFIGDNAYVVTFRQVDPLYVVDLSHPAAPRVTGQLELEGYSAYLHPLGGGLLLGVGRSIGAGNEPGGSQLSLFDVSDAAHPTLLAGHDVGGFSSSDAEYDHHAFLYWPATKLAVMPVEAYGDDDQRFVGAIGFRIERSGITEVGRITHPHDDQSLWPVQRATVVGDRILTLSDAGVLSSALSDLSAGPFVPFPDVPAYTGCGGYGGPGGPPRERFACPVYAGR